jgi:hypothetical protein
MDPGDLTDGDERENGDDKEKTTPSMPPVSDKVTYQHIQERSSELARTCQNDQPKMRTILCNINQMIERVSDGQDQTIPILCCRAKRCPSIHCKMLLGYRKQILVENGWSEI